MRAFGGFVGIILLAGLLGALLAYPAYELTAPFADWQFHRVASRVAMLVLLIGLIWLCRHLNLTRARDFGFGLPRRRFIAVSLLAALAGAVSAAAGAAFLLSGGLRVLNPAFTPSLGSVLRVTLLAASSAVSVALIEESVFRGAMHSAIEKESGSWMAVLTTAPLFAVLHFFAKTRIPAAEIGWGSGFYLLAHSFSPLGQPGQVLDALLCWLTVALILSLTRVMTGNIAVAIGLHAGWVLVLRLLQLVTVSGPHAHSAWVSQFDGLIGYWLLPWGSLIALLLWLTRSLWVPAARHGSASGESCSSRARGSSISR